MDKKAEFKIFVKANPRLMSFVKNGDMTWQKFYEMYDIYGTDNSVWNDYLSDKIVAAEPSTSAISFNDIVNWVRGIDLDNVQSGINNIQRVVGMVQDLTKKDTVVEKEEYKPRPIYKHFED